MVQVSTGASTVRWNPMAIRPDSAASVMGAFAVTLTRNLPPPGQVTTAPPETSRSTDPGAKCQRTTLVCDPEPRTMSSTWSPASLSDQRRRCHGWPGSFRYPSCAASTLSTPWSA